MSEHGLCAESDERIKEMLFCMVDLAIADIARSRGGKNMSSWSQSAHRWLNDIRPGDEAHITTFAGCCHALGADPEKMRAAILSQQKAHRTSHYVGRKNATTAHRLYLHRTYYTTKARKNYKCEYCQEWIYNGDQHYFRHLDGYARHAHPECVAADTTNKVEIRGKYSECCKRRAK